jgi:hypothetical protein
VAVAPAVVVRSVVVVVCVDIDTWAVVAVVVVILGINLAEL